MSGFVFVGGGTGSAFFEGAFMTGDFDTSLTGAILASAMFGFFTALAAEDELLGEDAEGLAVFCGATGLETGFTLAALAFTGFWATSFTGFLSIFPLAGAFVTGAFEETVFAATALVASFTFNFVLFEARVFFESAVFFCSMEGVVLLAGFDLLELADGLAAALVGGFPLGAVAFLLGLAVDNFTAAFGLAVFLRSVGKVKLLANLASKAT
jgi:hypothetical protein